MTKKIMIVDDEPEIVRSLAMRLHSKGFLVVTAVDAYQATEVALKELPDLILLDLGLPAGDGHVVAKRLRNSYKTAHIPIIVLTARTSQEDRVLAEENEVNYFITKPFDIDELFDCINNLI